MIRVTLIFAALSILQSCRISKKESIDLEGMWRFSKEKIQNGESLPDGILVENQQLFIIDSIQFIDRQYTLYGNGFEEKGEYHLDSEKQLHLTKRETSDAKEPTEVLKDLTLDLLILRPKKISFSRLLTFKFPDSKNHQVEIEGIFRK